MIGASIAHRQALTRNLFFQDDGTFAAAGGYTGLNRNYFHVKLQ
jgi:hypothetical protein